jgi:hypothetical protein
VFGLKQDCEIHSVELAPDDKTHAGRYVDKPFGEVEGNMVNAGPNPPAVPFEAMEVPHHAAQYALKTCGAVTNQN